MYNQTKKKAIKLIKFFFTRLSNYKHLQDYWGKKAKDVKKYV
jgi:hypothetical protein